MKHRFAVTKTSQGIDRLKPHHGLEVVHQGPGLNEGPLPTLFYFALSGEDSLTLEPINQPAVALVHARVRVFSMTLPAHGSDYDPVKAMHAWAEALANGDDVIARFLDQAEKNISLLIEEGLIDVHHLAIAGLSRGGFIAAHLAAREPRIGVVLGYAPLTRLDKVVEFQALSHNLHVQALDLFKIAHLLIHKHVRFYIGNRDTRVGTESAFAYIKALADSAYEQGIRSPGAELIVNPSIGHKGHGTSPETFNDGINWLQKIWKMKGAAL